MVYEGEEGSGGCGLVRGLGDGYRGRVRWGQGSGWRTLARETARNGTGRVQRDGSALPEGVRALRVVVADAAGNAAARTGAAVVAGPRPPLRPI